MECKFAQIFNTLAAVCEIDFAQNICILGSIADNENGLEDKQTHGSKNQNV